LYFWYFSAIKTLGVATATMPILISLILGMVFVAEEVTLVLVIQVEIFLVTGKTFIQIAGLPVVGLIGATATTETALIRASMVLILVLTMIGVHSMGIIIIAITRMGRQAHQSKLIWLIEVCFLL
jgi:hypothetical protein